MQSRAHTPVHSGSGKKGAAGRRGGRAGRQAGRQAGSRPAAAPLSGTPHEAGGREVQQRGARQGARLSRAVNVPRAFLQPYVVKPAVVVERVALHLRGRAGTQGDRKQGRRADGWAGGHMCRLWNSHQPAQQGEGLVGCARNGKGSGHSGRSMPYSPPPHTGTAARSQSPPVGGQAREAGEGGNAGRQGRQRG